MALPRILIDLQNDNPASGIGQYVRQIANGVAASGRYTVTGVQHKKTASGFDFPVVRSGISHRLVYDNRLFAAICPVSYERLVGVPDADISMFPANMIPSVQVRGKMIAVIHDMLPIRIKDFMRREGHGEHWFRTYEDRYRRISERADLICCVSEYTRDDVSRTFGVPTDRFAIVPPGADFSQFSQADAVRDAEVKRRLGLPDNYVLYFGADREYKNVDGLIRAFAVLPEAVRRKTHLVFSHTAGTHQALVDSLGLCDRVRFLGGVSGADRPAVYRLARAFAFLSYFEGFGMPPLEAMAAGVPVLVSDCASLPEVVGDAALIAPPDDYDKIARYLYQLLSDDELRIRQIAAGKARAEQFIWQGSVVSMLKALGKMI